MDNPRPIKPMKKKKKSKGDEDVIKTERDERRATGAEDENDFEDDKAAPLVVPVVGSFHNQRDLLNKRHVQRKIHRKDRLQKSQDPEAQTFPFMRLPSEVRTMIYKYLLVSRARRWCFSTEKYVDAHIYLGPSHYGGRLWPPGGIETAILSTCNLIYAEASHVLYTKNEFSVNLDGSGRFIDYRVDVPKTDSTRSLRNGRKVDMLKHTGLIYKHVVHRLRQIQFNINIPGDNRHYRSRYNRWGDDISTHQTIEKMAKLLLERGTQDENLTGDFAVHGKMWKVKLSCNGIDEKARTSLAALKLVVTPLKNEKFRQNLRDGKFSFTFDGLMPKGYKHIMRTILDNGATVGEVVEGKAAIHDLETRYEMFWAYRKKGLLKNMSYRLVETKQETKDRGGAIVRRCRGCGGLHIDPSTTEVSRW